MKNQKCNFLGKVSSYAAERIVLHPVVTSHEGWAKGSKRVLQMM